MWIPRLLQRTMLVAASLCMGFLVGLEPATSPSPARASDPLSDSLTAVSCPAADMCMAVGNGTLTRLSGGSLPMSERWNGKTWSIVPVPLPHGALWAKLRGISCPSAVFCVAVGTESGGAYDSHSLIESWSHGRWSVMSIPSQPNYSGQLESVSCASPTSCMAAGSAVGFPPNDGDPPPSSALAEHWNGRRWAVTPVPNIGPFNDWIVSVSCARSYACFAVGEYQFIGGPPPTRQLLDRWDGSTWRTVSLTLLREFQLVGVSCPDPKTCVVMGNRRTSSGAENLTATWVNGAWKTRVSASPHEMQGVSCANGIDSRDYRSSVACLDGFSCQTPRRCVLVGQTGTYQGLLEAWNGSSWSFEAVPKPSLALSVSVNQVGCNPSRCMAVGGYSEESLINQSGMGSDLTFAEVSGRRGWAPVPSENWPSSAGDLSAVDCSTASSCLAVGNVTDPSSGRMPLLGERLSGSRWSVDYGQDRAFPFQDTASVSCWSERGCFAAGYQAGPLNVPHAVVYRWNGTSWHVARLPSDSGYSTSEFFAVSCSSGASCFAVGDHGATPTSTGYFPRTLIERWNGAKWTIVPSPNLSTAKTAADSLYGVGCRGEGECFAVGSAFVPPAYRFQPLIEGWNGVTWHTMKTPSLVSDERLLAAGCASSGTCFAVGSEILEWTGSAWSKVKMVLPADGASGEFDPELMGVSCPGPRFCVSVGQYQSTKDGAQPLVETWTGHDWSVMPSPVFKGDTDAALNGVSCASPTFCLAVGQAETDSAEHPIVERWNGKRWMLVSIPQI